MTAEALSPDVPEIDHEHPDVTGGWLRPAVFGAMDGLVSNLALIAGVAGGTRDHTDTSAVVLAGLAGPGRRRVLDGGGGVHLGRQPVRGRRSARSTRSAARSSRNPQAETAELAEMYVAKGLDPALAAEVARQIHADVDNAVAVHAREELGVDPDDLASPMVAAGVVVPVVRGRRAHPGAALPARRRQPASRASS